MLELLSFGSTGHGDELLNGLLITVFVAIASYLCALCLGIAFSFLALAKARFIRAIWRVYRSIMMGVPSLIVIFIIYYNSPAFVAALTGRAVELSSMSAGILALTLVYAAYMGEVFRGAITNIPKGQFEAGHALGVRTLALWRLVVLPQAFRLALPALSNIWMVVLKDTALVSLVGLADLVRQSHVAANSTQQPFLFYFVTLAAFLVLAGLSHSASRRIEARLNPVPAQARAR
ncbi:MAG: ABC transporter permease [Pseudomonadota bacterium]